MSGMDNEADRLRAELDSARRDYGISVAYWQEQAEKAKHATEDMKQRAIKAEEYIERLEECVEACVETRAVLEGCAHADYRRSIRDCCLARCAVEDLRAYRHEHFGSMDARITGD